MSIYLSRYSNLITFWNVMMSSRERTLIFAIVNTTRRALGGTWRRTKDCQHESKRDWVPTLHSHPFPAEIKDAWSYASTPPYVFMLRPLMKREGKYSQTFQVSISCARFWRVASRCFLRYKQQLFYSIDKSFISQGFRQQLSVQILMSDYYQSHGQVK